MQCRNIERLIIESTEENLSPESQKIIIEHTALCDSCARFHEYFKEIRNGIQNIPEPAPSLKLLEETHALCLTVLAKGSSAHHLLSKRQNPPVPKLIWAAIFGSMFITALILPSGIKDLIDRIPSYPSVFLLGMILQNTIVLITAPILIRWRSHHGYRLSWSGRRFKTSIEV